MDGNDVIAQAQTGTGKTFAFILPILEKINLQASHVQALVVTPTRELALQITDEFEKLTNEIAWCRCASCLWRAGCRQTVKET